MIFNVYSIKDVLSGKMAQLELFNNDQMAKRYFANICSESKIKNDLQLFRVGSFNLDTGEIKADFEFICGGADFEG